MHAAGVDNPVAGCLLRHLTPHSATSRIVAALTVTSWLHVSAQAQPPAEPHATPVSPQPEPVVPQNLVQALFESLAAPSVTVTAEGVIQPYTELSAMYSAMQQHAQVGHTAHVNTVPHMMTTSAACTTA